MNFVRVVAQSDIATYEKWYGRGYGSKLIQYVSTFYKDMFGGGFGLWCLELFGVVVVMMIVGSV